MDIQSSRGALFPAVIAIVDVHGEEGALHYRAFDLHLDGQAERFATWEDAELVARELLRDVAMRRAWSALEKA